MKTLRYLLLIVCGTLLMALSCENPNVDTEEPPFLISYNILNKEGTKTTIVDKGENFIFSLVITNTSDEDWYVDHGSVIGSNITELYKKTSTGADSLHGSAYISAMCSFQSGVLIPAKGNYQTDIPWIADESITKVSSCGLSTKNNNYLPNGQYTTKMSGTIKIFRSEITHEIPLNKYNFAFQVL